MQAAHLHFPHLLQMIEEWPSTPTAPSPTPGSSFSDGGGGGGGGAFEGCDEITLLIWLPPLLPPPPPPPLPFKVLPPPLTEPVFNVVRC